ncbi:PEP-CTERM sorting domain-containing protein [Sphingomonas pokkalii]|uniref:PEP-CTERM sorting domain-containing protein n=1 Tax=Sphingomonas pokkalii TaxID=2175090 RepID=A0A2U0S994_9SPHN|nr:PEP-CTERM sorting domain-containing protein [Sphingomonas pokkalii]PVX27938.1 PEP-CTERM sorting domain-containing protein [Sphingomonas pokkalii]
MPNLARLFAFLLACAALAPSAGAKTILFVGNSFTYGANSPVMRYRPDRVTDLNREGVGGVPALFKTFAMEAGLDWQVSLETAGGRDLGWHFANRRALLDRRWDVVVLQGYSTLDPDRPGDPTRHLAAARALAEMFHHRNPAAQINLVATWSRADQVYRPGGHWHGLPVGRMAEDLLAANRLGLTPRSGFHAVLPVGTAWNRAMREGIADPNPYDGVAFGQVSLWTWDQYHASAEGYYLEALVEFGAITGRDPRSLGPRERAAEDLGINPEVARRLRDVAAAELAAQRVGGAP